MLRVSEASSKDLKNHMLGREPGSRPSPAIFPLNARAIIDLTFHLSLFVQILDLKGSALLHPRKFPVNLTIDPRQLIKHQLCRHQTISLGVPTSKRSIGKPFYLCAHTKEHSIIARPTHNGRISVAAGLADQSSDEISPSSTSHNRLHIPSVFKARSEFLFFLSHSAPIKILIMISSFCVPCRCEEWSYAKESK